MMFAASIVDKTILRICIFAMAAAVAMYIVSMNPAVLCVPVVVAYILLMGVNWKVAYWILLICIPFSTPPIGLANDTLSISLPDEPMSWLFMLLGIILVASQPDMIKRWWLLNPITMSIVLQFIWLFAAVVFSTVPLLSFKFMLAKSWYLVCFFIFPLWVFKKKQDFTTAFKCLFWPILISIIWILMRQVFLHFRFADVQAAVRWLYLNHVEYGAVISIFLPFVSVAYILTNKQNKKARWFLSLTVLLFLIAIYFSYARAAALAVVFSLVVAYAIRMRWVNIIMPTLYTIIAAGIIYLATNNKYMQLAPDYEHTAMHADYSSHLEATLQGRDMSSMERLYRWIAAVRMSTERPLTGYGPHGFVHNYKSYALPAFKTYVSDNDEKSTTHNYFLYMLTEQGWPAMILYAILIMVVFANAQSTYHRFKDRFYKLCTLALAMAFAACFINNFFSEFIETHKVGALFYITLALLVLLDKKSKEEQAQTIIS